MDLKVHPYIAAMIRASETVGQSVTNVPDRYRDNPTLILHVIMSPTILVA